MKANDWQDPTNARNLAISELAEVCAAMGLSWDATEKVFTIHLPNVILTPVTPQGVKHKKRFDVSIFGTDTAPDESQYPDYKQNLPDELPPANYTLDEGEAPKDKDEEK